MVWNPYIPFAEVSDPIQIGGGMSRMRPGRITTSTFKHQPGPSKSVSMFRYEEIQPFKVRSKEILEIYSVHGFVNIPLSFDSSMSPFF